MRSGDGGVGRSVRKAGLEEPPGAPRRRDGQAGEEEEGESTQEVGSAGGRRCRPADGPGHRSQVFGLYVQAQWGVLKGSAGEGCALASPCIPEKSVGQPWGG